MPLQPDMHLVSVDDHLVEPPTVWVDRLPSRWADTMPRIIEQDRGEGRPPAQVWTYEGEIYKTIGLNAVAGKAPEEWGMDPVRFDEMLPGCWDSKARLRDMDVDGVEVAACFPSFARSAGAMFLEGAKDMELALACVQAYNDFVLDEWCAVAPHRYIPIVIVPLFDPAAAVAEVHRTAAKGAKAIAFPENPVPLGLPSFHTDHWDPFLSAAEETGMPLTMHFGSSGKPPMTAPEAPFAVMISLFGCNSMYAMADLCFSPVFHRHPDLQVAFAEGGIGWMPYLLERMDYTWDRHRHYQNIDQTVPPSELVRRHISGCFIDDVHGLRSLDQMPVDNLTWEADYPHSDSNWPKSRERAEEVFADVPDDIVRKIVETNARRIYDFPRAPGGSA